MKKLGVCAVALLCLTACPAEETNNGNNVADMGSTNSNPPECPNSPPAAAEACAPEGLACTYSLACPCGDREDFTWTCNGGQLTQPSLTCSTGSAADCPEVVMSDMALPDGGLTDVSMVADTGADAAVDAGVDTGTPLPRLVAHGCTYATAMDQKGNAAVNLTDLLAWDLDHNNFCIIVDAGTVVSWTGNFTSHPLDGGVSPTEDAASPIDLAAEGAVGDMTVDVTVANAGDYPYFCSIHTGVMRGVVYVD